MRYVVSLFSGCGGLDIGMEGGFEVPETYLNPSIHPDWVRAKTRPGWVRLKKNLFHTVFANDIRPSAQKAWTNFFTREPFNLPADTFHLGSIIDLVKEAESGKGPLHGLRAHVVTGGFPCGDFSLAGKRKGFQSEKSHYGETIKDHSVPTVESRGMLYFWMRRVVEMIQPLVFIAENVKGMVSMTKVTETIENDFKNVGKKGYLVLPARVLAAPHFGVPQTRERVIFLGFSRAHLTAKATKELEKQNILPTYDPYPPPTHQIIIKRGQKDLFADNLARPVTTQDAFIGLGEPDEHPEDLSHLAFSRCKWYGRHCQGQTEVDLNGPGPTIRCEHHGNIEFRRLAKASGGKHHIELAKGLPQRRLSVRECLRIQSFPDDMSLVCQGISGSEAYKLVGNAVPPLLGFHIASRLEGLWPFLFGAKYAPK